MTDRHLHTAFLDLIDGRGTPHPGESNTACVSCEEARILRANFDREFDDAMRSMAPYPLPPETLTASTGSRFARRAVAWFAGIAAVLVISGIAVALPGLAPSAGPDATVSGQVDPEPWGSGAAETELDRWRAELPQVLERTTPFQAQIIRDGIVTQEEHDRAQRAYLQCVRDEDIVVGPSRDQFGLLAGLTLKGMDPNVDPDAVNTRCEGEFYADVWPGWHAFVTAGDTEEAQLARLAACLAARGYDVPASPETFGEIIDAIGRGLDARPDLGHCAEETRYP